MGRARIRRGTGRTSQVSQSPARHMTPLLHRFLLSAGMRNGESSTPFPSVPTPSTKGHEALRTLLTTTAATSEGFFPFYTLPAMPPPETSPLLNWGHPCTVNSSPSATGMLSAASCAYPLPPLSTCHCRAGLLRWEAWALMFFVNPFHEHSNNESKKKVPSLWPSTSQICY